MRTATQMFVWIWKPSSTTFTHHSDSVLLFTDKEI